MDSLICFALLFTTFCYTFDENNANKMRKENLTIVKELSKYIEKKGSFSLQWLSLNASAPVENRIVSTYFNFCCSHYSVVHKH